MKVSLPRHLPSIALLLLLAACNTEPKLTVTDAKQSADATTTADPIFMFVQEATGGTFTSTGATTGTVTLTGVGKQTVFFSDRPDKITGSLDTDLFIATFDWGPPAGPNAAIVIADPHPGTPDDQDTIIATLTEPSYELAESTVTYKVDILSGYTGNNLQKYTADADKTLPATFGKVSLFIDDCPSKQADCYKHGGVCCNNEDRGFWTCTNIRVGYCWRKKFPYGCHPCRDADQQCNNAAPSCCNNECVFNCYSCP